MVKSYTIKIAETDEQLDEVYELRYNHAFKSGADPKYALHQLKLYRDDYDNKFAKIFIAVDNTKKVIGTIRLLYKKETELPYEWCYDYDYISNRLGISLDQIYSRCALLDRGCIHPNFRGLGIYWEMVKLLEENMRKNDTDILLGTWIEADFQLALSHVRKANWILPDKKYINSKKIPYYFGFKIL